MPHRKYPTVWEFLTVGIIVFGMAVIVFPIFMRPLGKDSSVSCMSNEKQLALCFIQYTQDNDNILPEGTHARGVGWGGQVYPYAKLTDIYKCPDDHTLGTPTRFVVSYGYNVNVARHPALTPYAVASHTVLLFEVSGTAADVTHLDESAAQGATAFSAAGDGTDGMLNAGHAAPRYATGDLGGRMNTSTTQFADPRHDAGSNFVFADGHVKWSQPRRISSGANAVRPTDGQTGTIHGTAAGTGNTAYAGTFSVK